VVFDAIAGGLVLEVILSGDVPGMSHEDEPHGVAALVARRELLARYARDLMRLCVPSLVQNGVDARLRDFFASLVRIGHVRPPFSYRLGSRII
jgi:hypothetical protein